MRRVMPAPCACLLVLMTACSALAPTPLPTFTPTVTATSTPTIIWFPPTDTPTAFPMPTTLPTLELHPGLGEILFSDDFSQPELWPTAVSGSASVVINRNRLMMNVAGRPKIYLISIRAEPVLADFYAEVTVSLSLCREKDAYGVLLRAMSANDYYRYDVNCNGQVRLESVRSGQAFPLHDWTPSGDAPPGSPGEVRIGVWAAGTEMRFFMNGRHQFTVYDRLFKSGRLGLFVTSGGSTALTVSFSDLVVYAVSYASPTPTATSSRTPTPTRTPRP